MDTPCSITQIQSEHINTACLTINTVCKYINTLYPSTQIQYVQVYKYNAIQYVYKQCVHNKKQLTT